MIPPNRLWTRLQDTPSFYANLPWTPEGQFLWNFIKDHDPTILTGCPTSFFERAAFDKRTWRDRELGAHVPVITCLSKDKPEYATPGAILIDDRAKLGPAWEARGGHFIHHVEIGRTLTELQKTLTTISS
jgi:hypothetical protein